MEVIKIIASQNITDSTSNKLVTGTGRLNEEIADRPVYQQVGFTSIPKANSRHIGLLDGNQVTIVAGTDTEDDRPVLSNGGDCAIYSSKEIYIKIESSGDITIKNEAVSGGQIKILANGDIELGQSSLLKLINENFQQLFNDHVHNFIAAPSGTFSTSKPALLVGTTPISSVGGAVVTFDARIGANELTSKTEAE